MVADVTFGIDTDAFPDALSVMVWLALPAEYDTVAFGVPVKLTVAEVPLQTGELLEIEAVAKLPTAIVMLPLIFAVHGLEPGKAALTRA